MSTITADIIAGLKSEIAAQLGPEYSELAYTNDVLKNSFRMHHNRYGVRQLTALESTTTVTKYVTFIQPFEMILTKRYVTSNVDDSKEIAEALELVEQMWQIFIRVTNNKAGVPSSVLNITNLNMQEPQYIEEEKVVVLRATCDILFRLSLI